MISSTTLIWIVMGAVMLLSLVVQNRLNSRFSKYSEEPLNISGAEVASRMLAANGIRDVQITCIDCVQSEPGGLLWEKCRSGSGGGP